MDLTKYGLPKKLLLLIYSTFLQLTASGILYGWSALVMVLIKQGTYLEYCSSSEPMCEERQFRFSLAFTCGIVSIGFSNFINGILLDFWGPRFQTFLSFCVMILGSIFFTISKYFDGYIIGCMLFAFGGMGVYFGLMPLAEFFSPFKSTVLGIHSCAFDASTIVFIVYMKIFEFTHLSTYSFFALYTIIPMLGILEDEEKEENKENLEEKKDLTEKEMDELNEIDIKTSTEDEILNQIAMENQEELQEIKEEHFEEINEETMEEEDLTDINLQEEPKFITENPVKKLTFFDRLFLEISRVFHILKRPKISSFFLLYYVQSLWLNIYIASLPSRIFALSNQNQALTNYYVEIFGWVTPVIIFVAPFIGLAVDKLGLKVTFPFIIILSTICTGVFFIPILWVQIVSFVMFTIWRGFFYSWSVSYIFENIGIQDFGKVMGILNFSNSVVSTLQYLILYVAIFTNTFFYVDIIQLVSLSWTSFFAYFLF
eukprot:gene10066-2488_t